MDFDNAFTLYVQLFSAQLAALFTARR